MFAEYGILTSNEISANFSALIDRAVNFLQTPEGIATVIGFFLVILFLTRNKHK